MRRFAPAVAIACLLVLAPSGAARTPACGTAGKTVVANSKVRVYWVSSFGRHDFYACAFKTPRQRRPLGSDHVQPTFRQSMIGIQLRGRFLGYGLENCSEGYRCEWDAYAIDMGEGRGRAVIKKSGGGAVKDVLMTRARSVALLTDVSALDDKTRTYRVLKIEQEGRTLLDQSPEIDPHSLAVSRHRVYWMHGADVRSAHIE